jgi:hypothetical protein
MLIAAPIAGHAATLSPEDASSHVNEAATVCGLVASAMSGFLLGGRHEGSA